MNPLTGNLVASKYGSNLIFFAAFSNEARRGDFSLSSLKKSLFSILSEVFLVRIRKQIFVD